MADDQKVERAFGIYRLVFQAQRGLLTSGRSSGRSGSPSSQAHTPPPSQAIPSPPPQQQQQDETTYKPRVERRATFHVSKSSSGSPGISSSNSATNLVTSVVGGGLSPRGSRRGSNVLVSALKPFKTLRRKLVGSKRALENLQSGLKTTMTVESSSNSSTAATTSSNSAPTTPVTTRGSLGRIWSLKRKSTIGAVPAPNVVSSSTPSAFPVSAFTSSSSTLPSVSASEPSLHSLAQGVDGSMISVNDNNHSSTGNSAPQSIQLTIDVVSASSTQQAFLRSSSSSSGSKSVSNKRTPSVSSLSKKLTSGRNNSNNSGTNDGGNNTDNTKPESINQAAGGIMGNDPNGEMIDPTEVLLSGFLYVQLFALRGKSDTPRTFFALLSRERFSLLLSDEVGAQPIASVLLTELNDIQTSEILLGDDDGPSVLKEKSCTLYSHTIPYCTFSGPVNEIDAWFAIISKAMKDSFDLLISRAVHKMGLVEHRRASSLKDQYQIQGDRGIGGSAFIKTAISKESGRPVIVKFVNKALSESGQDGLPVEVSTLLSTKHANIVEVKEVYESPDYFIIVMDKFGEGVDLFDYIQNAERLPENEARLIFVQIVNAVVHLAENNIVHGDIKDENIIIDGKTGQIKLIDFGSNKRFAPEDHFERYTGTPQMACPEAASNQPFNPMRQELWSLGVLLYILLTGDYPFETANDIREGNIKRIADDILLEVSEDSLDVIERLLQPDSHQQMTLEQLRRHRWLRQERA